MAAEPNEPALPAEKSLPAAQAPVTESLATDEATTADRTEAPKLALQVVAPANAKVGQRYVIVFTIRNVGRVDAKKVVLHVDLPPELSYPYGRLLKYDVGELRAGQSHAARLTARVDRPGRLIIRSRLLLKGHAVQDISSVARAVR
ncbi:MAG: hypothetical protein GXP27_07735 [Planctomycetes bacterium]|nr:hypothetical protein [Planctomycetota bacterium]